VALFGPPDVAKLDARGNIDGLVKAAKYRKDPEVAEAARKALERRLDAIIEALQSKHLPQLLTSREALVLIGPPARDRLIFILKNGHLHRRQDAAYVLGLMGDPEAVGALTLTLHNPDALLRMLCVEALGKIGDPGCVDTLRRAVGDSDPTVAGAARKALKKLGALPQQG
jgi:HEAT repeat protein